MKERSPIAVLLLPFVTFGIYSIYWMVVTKGEMNERGATIPTAWLIIVPFVNIWWMWKYSEGVDHVTASKMSGVLAFILLWFLGPIANAIIQDSFNKVGGSPVAAAESNSSATIPEESASPESTPPTTPSVSG